MPGFVAALRQRDGVAARCLEFVVLTACRSGEARGARWSEIDLTAKLWTIPPERMKAGKPHRVPLSAETLAVLEALPRMAGTDLFSWRHVVASCPTWRCWPSCAAWASMPYRTARDRRLARLIHEGNFASAIGRA